MKNITIVGGGACGVATFLELLIQITIRDLSWEIAITIMEKEKPIGYGLAFGTNQPGHLLNTQANLMGLFAAEPGHFSDWLDKHKLENPNDIKGKGDTESSYTTRHLYGDYIAAHYREYVEKAHQSGLNLTIIEAEATDLEPQENGYEVIYDNGSHYADYVILALGTPKPNNYPEFKQLDNYVDFPYPADKLLNNINLKEDVGVLGSSLSALDTIITLVDNGHQGKIRLFSPDGLLPRVQPVENHDYKREFLTIEVLHALQRETCERPGVKDLFRLFRQDVEKSEGKAINWKKQNRMGKNPHELLKKDLEVAHSGGDGLINVAYSLRYDSENIWSMLSIDQKILFKKWLGPHWMVNRHGMPIPNAERLLELFDAGLLEVQPFLEDVTFDRTKGLFLLKTKTGTTEIKQLVNATGPATQLDKMDSRLIENLCKKQLLKEYPIGGTIVNPRTMEVLANKAGSQLYAVGHLVNGMLMDVNAVWYNVKTIQRLSHDIILKIRNEYYY
jgi:uncharacterized NAD(P)/FAD-binding protein YdhS